MNRPIYSYTRQQAIDDGLLVDISETEEAKEAGFIVPITLTVGVYQLCQVPEGLEGIQDLKGRLWDTVYIAALAHKRWKADPQGNDGRILSFQIIYQMTKTRRKLLTLWLVFNETEGFTIMRPDEY